jgi:hypothetical protein
MTDTTKLPSLRLDQSGLDPHATAVLPGERSEQWYLFREYAAGETYWRASKTKRDRDGRDPAATVEVVLPNLMFGGEDEIRDDVAAAVERHAARHLGD